MPKLVQGLIQPNKNIFKKRESRGYKKMTAVKISQQGQTKSIELNKSTEKSALLQPTVHK